jgi:hypothetical protein
MKNLFLIFATVLLGFTSYGFETSMPLFPTNGEDIEIVFTDSMDKAQLDSIQKDLGEKGIVLTYKTLEFNKKNKLRRIDFAVECPTHGFRGSASNKLLGFTRKFGFALEGTKTGNATFKVGAI